jgi:hypothetical protein
VFFFSNIICSFPFVVTILLLVVLQLFIPTVLFHICMNEDNMGHILTGYRRRVYLQVKEKDKTVEFYRFRNCGNLYVVEVCLYFLSRLFCIVRATALEISSFMIIFKLANFESWEKAKVRQTRR